MRKYSLPVRVAAFACALCLLLTGCGQVASPDDSGDTSTPVRESHPAAEAKAAQEELEAARQEVLAAQEELEAAQRAAAGARMAQLAVQLATEHLGKNVTLTNVVSFSVDDFEGAPCHVLLLRNADDRYLAYSYDTEAVYCPSWDDFGNGTDDFSTEEGRCFHLLRTFDEHSDDYYNDTETRIELTAAEIAKINEALVSEEVQPAADDAALAALERKAAQLAAAAIKAQAAQAVSEQWGQDAVLTDVVDYSIDEFEGVPCHVLMLKDADDRYLAYSCDSETVYCPSSDDVRRGTDDWSTEESRCLYLLWGLYNHIGAYFDSEETRTELTAAEIVKVNRALAQGIVPAAEETPENPTAAPATEPAAAEVTTSLPADVALPRGSGAYKVLSECPEEFARRELSDEEISALAQGDLETARKRISTGGDFAAWLIAMGGQISCNIVSNGEGQKTVGADFDFEWIRQMVDSAMAAALAVRVLGDDLPGIGIVAARVAENGGTFLFGSLIPAEDGYYLLSCNALTDEWKAAVEAGMPSDAFLPIWVDGFAGITAWCRSADNPRGNTLT